MKQIDITPAAHEDIAKLKSYLTREFDIQTAKRIVNALYDDLEKLSVFPGMGMDILGKYGIKSDYLCLLTQKNYAFYRIEGDFVRIIRILDERQDFMRILFGIKTTTDETEAYWKE